MKIKFLGGAEVVGKMGMLLQNKGASLLFEYGMTASKPPQYPLAAPPVDMAFLTHSHLDHCGMLPWLCGKYDTEVVSTPLTAAVVERLVRDSLKIAGLEGYPKPYDEEDIQSLMHNFTGMTYGEIMDVGGFEVELHPAGHLPGAAMYELRGDQTTVFTGDMHTANMRLVWGAHPVKCDNLILEATYSGRNHPDRAKTERELIEKVKEVVERGGKAILPCFAVGRTQEVMLILKDLKYNMWVDGMGKTISRYYLDRPEYVRNEKALRAAKRKFHEVRTPADRHRARKEAQVIVTTGGMLDGGPVLSYIDDVKDDPRSAILLSGFQVEGSNGHMLLNEGIINVQATKEELPHPVKIKCEVRKYDLSAHADHNELLAFVRACDPDTVVLMHSDDRSLLAKDIEADGRKVIMPTSDVEFEL
ncbi:MAG TPA: MBL fold metallo-hydrolase [Methanomassiliicoccaceae archaeon]|nr:MBL fold metallo-hydrolase [Methanomassiliicoccaceae archaeon]